MENQELVVKITGYYTQHHKEQKMDLAELHMKHDGKIHTKGHDTVGDFVIDGEIHPDGKVHFKKQYTGKHSVQYNGTLEDRVIKGKWSVDGQTDDFRIEVQAELWEGHYMQNGKEHKLTAIFGFDEHKNAFGLGHDEIGSSIWSGKFEGDDLQLWKQYVGKHRISYRGKHTQDEFKGEWKYNEHTKGEFVIHRR